LPHCGALHGSRGKFPAGRENCGGIAGNGTEAAEIRPQSPEARRENRELRKPEQRNNRDNQGEEREFHSSGY
jgi:hypothetical protein